MLSAYVNASDMEGAEKFFKRFEQDGLEPNVVTYGTLIKGYARVNDLDKMMERYEGMRGRGIKANQTIFTTIMDAYGKNKDFGSAVIWFKEMESCGVPPDQKAKNILLSLAKTVEEQDESRELVGHANLNSNARLASLPLNYVDEDSDDDDHDDEKDYDAEKVISFDEEQVELVVFNGHYQQNEEGLHSLSFDKL